MLFSGGQISKRSLESYKGPRVKTSEEWLALGQKERELFAAQMDVIGPIMDEVYKRAHSRREKTEVVECKKCGGKGHAERHPRKVGVFSPSGLTYCCREMYFQLLGEPGKKRIDTTSQVTFDHGTALHEWYQDRYLHPRFPGPPDTKVTFKSELASVLEELSIYGHADGQFESDLIRVGFEIKTASASSFAKMTKPTWPNLAQNTTYNMANDWPGSIFLFIEKDYPHQLSQFFFGFDPEIAEWVTSRLASIEAAAEEGEPPEPDVDTNWACKRCKYFDICRFGGGEV